MKPWIVCPHLKEALLPSELESAHCDAAPIGLPIISMLKRKPWTVCPHLKEALLPSELESAHCDAAPIGLPIASMLKRKPWTVCPHLKEALLPSELESAHCDAAPDWFAHHINAEKETLYCVPPPEGSPAAQ